MTKKQIKTEFPNEVDILRSTLAEVKVKLPGLDAFLLANPVSSFWVNIRLLIQKYIFVLKGMYQVF